MALGAEWSDWRTDCSGFNLYISHTPHPTPPHHGCSTAREPWTCKKSKIVKYVSCKVRFLTGTKQGWARGWARCRHSYTCRSSATAARIHLAAFSLVFRLKVQT